MKKKYSLIIILALFTMLQSNCSSSESNMEPEVEDMDSTDGEDEENGTEDSEEEVDDPETVFEGVFDPEAVISSLYEEIATYVGSQDKLLALSEITTDALIVPGRGAEWSDNGVWRVLHTHEWDANHQYISEFWEDWSKALVKSSEVIHPNSNASSQTEAEGRFFRALASYMFIDNFGLILNVNLDSQQPPQILKGQDAVDYIIGDLEAALVNLPSIGAGNGQNLSKVGKSAARYLYAKVVLNAFVYRGDNAPTNDEMNKVIELVNLIESEGFGLASGYFDIFRSSSDSETIWFLETPVGNRIFNSLHFNSTQIGGGGWNGFGTLAEYYDLFEGESNQNRLDSDGNPLDNQEERRGGVPPSGRPYTGEPGTTEFNGLEDGSNVGVGFLIGQQYALDGSPLTERNGDFLIFTREYEDAGGSPSILNNGESDGIRMLKYSTAYGAFISHLIFFRFADAYLMKAEAMMRSGQDPTTMINNLRSIRGAQPLASVGTQEVLDERARELFNECWRRNDLIRFDQFTKAWELKSGGEVGNEIRNLFPIPVFELSLNPNLIQNPGY